MNLNYSIGTLIRAALALIGSTSASAMAAAPNGVDVSGLDLGQWLTAIGLGLGAAGALLHKPKDAAGANEKAVTSIQNVTDTAVLSHEKLTQVAVDSIKAVTDSVGGLAGLLPGASVATPELGPLAAQIISQIASLKTF